jgi:tetratricopeptide (TPR) repeat protein
MISGVVQLDALEPTRQQQPDQALPTLASNPVDAESLLHQAELLERRGDDEAALHASRRATALWPDITPAYRLQLRQARRIGDHRLAIDALRHLLAAKPDDPMLNSEMGASLSAIGDFDRAVPFLRQAAPILLHGNFTIWNYTTALATTGRHRELIDIQPLLDRMAAETMPAPYPPYAYLAAAKLAAGFDRPWVIGAMAALQNSANWLDDSALHARLAAAIRNKTAFSLIRLDHGLSRLLCYTSMRAHLVLRPAELSAVANSVWPDWFGETVEASGPAAMASVGSGLAAAIANAAVVGLPDAEIFRHDHASFGFLAEMQRTVPTRYGGAFTSSQFAVTLHQSMPFLRSTLHGLDFLAVIGPFPNLASRLGSFCGISDTQEILVGRTDDRATATPGMSALAEAEQALGALRIPFAGAVYLVGVGGPYGILFCERIRALGGIAVDIGAVAAEWAKA